MKKDGRKSRKKSARPTLTGKKCPRQSEQWKRLWADPVTREKMLAHNRRIARDPNKRTREGTFDGMTHQQSVAATAAARASAEKTVKELEEKGVFDDVSEEDKENAKLAMAEAIATMKLHKGKQLGLTAAALVLKFTKQTPAQKKDITLNAAEAWLAAVAEDAEDDEPEASSDA